MSNATEVKIVPDPYVPSKDADGHPVCYFDEDTNTAFASPENARWLLGQTTLAATEMRVIRFSSGKLRLRWLPPNVVVQP